MRVTRTTWAAAVGAVVLAAAGCGGTAGNSQMDEPAKVGKASITFLSGQPEGEGSSLILTDLTKKYGHGSSVDIEPNTDFAQFDAKIQQYASQDALPTVLHIGTPKQAIDLYESGQIVDVEKLLEELGVMDDVNPLSVQLQKKLYDGHMLGLPIELAIEGFFYNKTLFAENGIEAPKTWADMTAAAAKLDAAGVQPFAASGKAGWPLTRLVSGYIERTVGPDAMSAVKDGSAKLTDPEYVAGAQALADLGAKGYFGEGVATLDSQPAEDLFLQGKAGMFYAGNWALAQLNDPEVNKVGADKIGFFPLPLVDGGKGTAKETPANGGFPLMVSSKELTPTVKAWVKYVVQHYGDTAMDEADIISGFKTTVKPGDQLTTDLLGETSQVSVALPWFEAPMTPEATDISQRNAAGLVSGSLSPAAFMKKVQAGLR